MDTEKTRAFYSQLSGKDICGCAYCQNYVRQIRAAYPEAADYLSRLGVDVEKPLETMPLEPDETGQLEYAGPQYIVCGTPEGFTETQIGSVRIEIAASHPRHGSGGAKLCDRAVSHSTEVASAAQKENDVERNGFPVKEA